MLRGSIAAWCGLCAACASAPAQAPAPQGSASAQVAMVELSPSAAPPAPRRRCLSHITRFPAGALGPEARTWQQALALDADGRLQRFHERWTRGAPDAVSDGEERRELRWSNGLLRNVEVWRDGAAAPSLVELRFGEHGELLEQTTGQSAGVEIVRFTWRGQFGRLRGAARTAPDLPRAQTDRLSFAPTRASLPGQRSGALPALLAWVGPESVGPPIAFEGEVSIELTSEAAGRTTTVARLLRYDGQGRKVFESDPGDASVGWTLAWDGAELASATHTHGARIELVWKSGHLARVLFPDEARSEEFPLPGFGEQAVMSGPSGAPVETSLGTTCP